MSPPSPAPVPVAAAFDFAKFADSLTAMGAAMSNANAGDSVPTVDQYVAVLVMSPNYDMMLLTWEGQHKAWFLPSGRVEEGETPVAAGVREVLEETGLAIPPSCELRLFNVHRLVREHQQVTLSVYVTVVPLDLLLTGLRQEMEATRMAVEANFDDLEEGQPAYVDCLVSGQSTPVYPHVRGARPSSTSSATPSVSANWLLAYTSRHSMAAASSRAGSRATTDATSPMVAPSGGMHCGSCETLTLSTRWPQPRTTPSPM